MNPGFEYYRPFGSPATGSITITAKPTAGDTVTINGVVYTYGTNFFGATAIETAVSLTAAINATRGLYHHMHGMTQPIRDVYAVYYGALVRLVATVPGPGGNSITLATSAATTFVLSGAVMTGGGSTAQTVLLGAFRQSLPALTNEIEFAPTGISSVYKVRFSCPTSNTGVVKLSFAAIGGGAGYGEYTLVAGASGYVVEAPPGFQFALSNLLFENTHATDAQNLDGDFFYSL